LRIAILNLLVPIRYAHMGVAWQAALGAVFLSGTAFLVLTALGVRQLIIATIPFELYASVAGGVGLFIAFIGFWSSGIILANPATTVAMGNLRDKSTALALFGLLLRAALLAWRVRAAMLIGILATTAIGLATGVAKWTPQSYHLADLAATAGKLDIAGVLRLGFLEIIFVFRRSSRCSSRGAGPALPRRILAPAPSGGRSACASAGRTNPARDRRMPGIARDARRRPGWPRSCPSAHCSGIRRARPSRSESLPAPQPHGAKNPPMETPKPKRMAPPTTNPGRGAKNTIAGS
jgi:hypothetical protein